MRILVTGGAGFIGSYLVDRLTSDRMNEVIVLDTFSRETLEDPLEQVPQVVDSIRSRILNRKATSESSNQ